MTNEQSINFGLNQIKTQLVLSDTKNPDEVIESIRPILEGVYLDGRIAGVSETVKQATQWAK